MTAVGDPRMATRELIVIREDGAEDSGRLVVQRVPNPMPNTTLGAIGDGFEIDGPERFAPMVVQLPLQPGALAGIDEVAGYSALRSPVIMSRSALTRHYTSTTRSVGCFRRGGGSASSRVRGHRGRRRRLGCRA